MAPISVTETELETNSHKSNWIESTLTHRGKDSNNDSTTRVFTTNTYEKMLRPEPSFLKPIRRLEQRLGFITPLRWVNIIAIITIHTIAIIYALHFIITRRSVDHWLTVPYGKYLYISCHNTIDNINYCREVTD